MKEVVWRESFGKMFSISCLKSQKRARMEMKTYLQMVVLAAIIGFLMGSGKYL